MDVEEIVPPRNQEQQVTAIGDASEKPAETAVAAPGGKAKQREFRPDIQGLRALAVGMVVFYHLYPSLMTGGFAGVDVFFVISGFLITGHLLREYRKTGRVGLLEFWGRRAKRLVPAAALVLTVTWAASRLVLPATRLADTAAQIRASALYYENWQLAWNAVDYLKSDSAASPVQHFWSLSVEEQFYLGWPFLFVFAALVALTVRRRPGTPGKASSRHGAPAGTACSSCSRPRWSPARSGYSVYDTRVNPSGAYFVTTTRIWELGLGGLIALLPERLGRRLGRLGLLGWAGLGLVIASAFALSGTQAFPGVLALLPAGGAALLILGGSAAARFGPSRLTSAAAAGVHRRHLLLAVPVALAGHRAVDDVARPPGRPGLRPGHRRGRRRCSPGRARSGSRTRCGPRRCCPGTAGVRSPPRSRPWCLWSW